MVVYCLLFGVLGCFGWFSCFGVYLRRPGLGVSGTLVTSGLRGGFWVVDLRFLAVDCVFVWLFVDYTLW